MTFDTFDWIFSKATIFIRLALNGRTEMAGRQNVCKILCRALIYLEHFELNT